MLNSSTAYTTHEGYGGVRYTLLYSDANAVVCVVNVHMDGSDIEPMYLFHDGV